MRIFVVGFSFVLCACETLEDDVARYQQMSCGELGYELAYWRSKLDDAENDSLSASLDSVFAEDEKEEDDADTREWIADSRVDDAKDHINELRLIRARKSC